MSDTASTPQTSKTQALFNELADDRVVVEHCIAAYKKDGAKGLLSVFPEAVKEIQEDVVAAIAAAPEIKAGYKTTEFWLTIGASAAILSYSAITGKASPVPPELLVTVLVGIYAATRGLAKKPVAPAA